MATVSLKRVLVGRPRQSRELKHQLLPKWMALPVFSSDPLSSTAYATQEMMVVLSAAGLAAYSYILPLSLGVAALLIVVVISYRQTVREYPHGGGAYIVARENLGDVPGLTAASALLIDYTLTVSVSIAAGVAAITSAIPGLLDYRLPIALAFVALVTLANLRGVREAGAVFALPTYLFVATVLTMIGWGAIQCVGGCPQAPSAGTPLEAESAITLFLLLRAFSSGATALTGVEAISNGVPAFRYPQSRNAAQTLAVMGAISVTMFLGTSFLARATGVVHTEESTRTVMAEIALTVFGGQGVGFYLVQFVTAAILILAANTAYADFPRLASVLAVDRFLPRHFVSRGDRLVFSNGILVLAGAASLLLIIFNSEVTRLIQLYVVGVFTSFTLSQAGMVIHHRRVREPGWQRSAVINAIGAITTGVVLVVVAVSKFVGGAWIVIIAIPLLVLLMARIRSHYLRVSVQLRAGMADESEAPRPTHVRIVIRQVDEAAARAVSYAQGIAAASVEAYALPGADGVEQQWARLTSEVPLRLVPPGGNAIDRLRSALKADAARHPSAFTLTLVAETLSTGWLEQLVRHRVELRVKTALLSETDLVVADLTSPQAGPGPYTVEEPVEHHVVVLVSQVNRSTMRALSFAHSLAPTTIRALSVNLDTNRSMRILYDWEDWGIRTPLEVVDSPYRSLTDALRAYLREFEPDGRRVFVTCVLPEFVLPHWYQQPLHNQSALVIKSVLLFERGVVTASVPFPVPDEPGGEMTAPGTGRAAAP